MTTEPHWLDLKIPPLVIVALTALLMWLAARATPQLIVLYPARVAIAAGIALLGIAVTAAGVIAFAKAKTTVNPHSPGSSTHIVTSGIYRFTRNPMYVGMTLLLFAWAAYLTNVAAAIVPFAFVAYITLFQIHPEERILISKFGREYEDYLRAVRRWV